MANSLLTDLREHLERVKNPFLFLGLTFLVYIGIAVMVLVGVYFYTRH
jgi:hypothetical protein